MDVMFVWGLIIGYITGCISGVVIEAIMVVAGKSDKDE